MRFTPGGIRKGAAGFDVCFIHPKGSDEAPVGGEGVLIELVQAPPDVIEAHARVAASVSSTALADASETGRCVPRCGPLRISTDFAGRSG